MPNQPANTDPDRGSPLDPEPLFHALSDEIRRRILCLIVDQGELCVCELFYALDLPQPKVSRHLAVLRDSGVLALRRAATRVFYRLHPGLPLWAHRVLTAMSEGVTLQGAQKCDVERLVRMPNRPRRGALVAAA